MNQVSGFRHGGETEAESTVNYSSSTWSRQVKGYVDLEPSRGLGPLTFCLQAVSVGTESYGLIPTRPGQSPFWYRLTPAGARTFSHVRAPRRSTLVMQRE